MIGLCGLFSHGPSGPVERAETAMWLANLLIHAQSLELIASADRGQDLMLNLILLLVALILAGLRIEQQQSAGERANRAAELRSEHQSLQQDLARLKSQAEQERPVVYLGGTDQIDLVLDLTAVERPVPPARSSSLKRAFVSSAVPKPANMRMVHRRPR